MGCNYWVCWNGRDGRATRHHHPQDVQRGGQAIATRVSGDPVSTNNGLFYFHSDHPSTALRTSLGSATFLTHGNGHANEGLKVANSTKFYTPFVEYRIEPPSPVDGISDRGYTGHKHNDYIKLIYMGARWYLPNTNRWLSPVMIIPDQTNPQSFNCYSYVLNRPLNFSDPTGHRECGFDCNDPLPPEPPPSILEQVQQGNNVYGITFAADDGEAWTEEQMVIVLSAVAAVDRQLRIAGGYSGYSPGYAFRKVYGSYTMLRSSKTHYTDSEGVEQEITYGGETFGWRNTIEFYDPAFNVHPLDLDFRNNVVHELGHAFNSEIVTASDGDIDPYNDLTVALSEGGELYNYRLNPRDVMEDYPWQQSKSNKEGEVFADYFLNWTYNNFLNNDAYNWMTGQMDVWLP